MSKLTIVTAFFKIKRENWTGFERSDQLYFDYFKVWGKLKNKLIVYVESEQLKKDILDFRKSYGLEDDTIVNIVPDCLNIEPELLENVKRATANNIQKKFRLFQKNPEVWNGIYNYIMLMKGWCICDAIERGQAKGMIAWVDFGYNHGGSPISAESDFNFMWEYDFPKKINLFTLHEMDDRPIFEMIMSMDTYLMGCAIVGYEKYWPEFWSLMKQSMQSLIDCGLCDDDQNIMLMSYRKKPEIFNIIPSEWTKMMYQFGGEHLIWLPDLVHKNLLKKIFKKYIRKIRFNAICLNYAWRIFKHMRKVNVK